MQSSVRAVEAYRRSRLIDNVTTDEDKVSPVYRLEEICTFLRNSPLDIVREMLEYTLKRLEHKSPIVKQKTLRFIKFASVKAGPEFKREMQRQAQQVRQLFHYKGQLDALKGDALNKAVRETAHEAVAAIFGTEEKTTTMEDVGKRIQGFGSTNFDMPKEEEKKSVLSGLVGFGSNSLRQSIDMINNYNHYSGSTSGSGKNLGSYRGGQSLRKSLNAERERPFEKEEVAYWDRDAEAVEGRGGSSPNAKSQSKSGDGGGRGNNSDGRAGGHTSEDRLLDSLTAPGGVRLQPTRETLQTFTVTSQKLNAANLVHSIETKLRAHSWQVRYKALCLLEASIRSREDNKVLDSVVLMFEEDASPIVDSLQSPQTSLREKAKKVMDMLGGGLKDGNGNADVSAETNMPQAAPKLSAPINYPDLMDTGNFDLLDEPDSLQSTPNKEQPERKVVHPSVQQDLLDGADLNFSPVKASATESESDPFAGMSFHSFEGVVGNGGQVDLFSGLDVDSGRQLGNGAVESLGLDEGNSLLEGLSITNAKSAPGPQSDLLELMGNLSTGNSTNYHEQKPLQGFPPTKPVQQSIPSAVGGVSNSFRNQLPGMVVPGQVPAVPGMPPQMMFMHPSGMMPMGVPGFVQQNMMQQAMQQAMTSGNMNFAFAGAFGQQQFAGSVPGMPMFGGMMPNTYNGGVPNQKHHDSFDFSSDATARYAAVENTKEDTKAFDFISDHMSMLGPKKSK